MAGKRKNDSSSLEVIQMFARICIPSILTRDRSANGAKPYTGHQNMPYAEKLTTSTHGVGFSLNKS